MPPCVGVDAITRRHRTTPTPSGLCTRRASCSWAPGEQQWDPSCHAIDAAARPTVAPGATDGGATAANTDAARHSNVQASDPRQPLRGVRRIRPRHLRRVQVRACGWRSHGQPENACRLERSATTVPSFSADRRAAASRTVQGQGASQLSRLVNAATGGVARMVSLRLWGPPVPSPSPSSPHHACSWLLLRSRCPSCRASGRWCCAKCMGTGVRRQPIGFRVPSEEAPRGERGGNDEASGGASANGSGG